MADGTHATTTLERLDNRNYPTWRYKMSLHLKSKGLWSVVEGMLPTGDEDMETMAAWEKQNVDALNTLVQTLSSSQTSYVLNQSTAKGAWQKLEEVHRGKVIEKKVALKRTLNTINWTKQESATDYMQRVESLGEELRALGETLDDAELAAIAIQGLPRAYHGVARSFDVCAMGDITVEKVRYALLREEQRQKQDEAADEAACRAKVRARKKFNCEPSFKCYRCGKPGHLARNCTTLSQGSGRALNFEQRNAGNRRPPHRARLATDGDDDHRGPGSLSPCRQDSGRDFAFGATCRGSPNDYWTVDSGASSHMTGCRSFLENYVPHEGRVVSLADGTKISAVGTGEVRFRTTDESAQKKLTAREVLLVPGMMESCLRFEADGPRFTSPFFGKRL